MNMDNIYIILAVVAVFLFMLSGNNEQFWGSYWSGWTNPVYRWFGWGPRYGRRRGRRMSRRYGHYPYSLYPYQYYYPKGYYGYGGYRGRYGYW